jgi:hypothetical protein
MNSTNNEKQPFSMNDFEKGLMLAGFLLPNSITELNERASLEEYEKEQKKNRAVVYFKRAVLAAEIASQLHSEPTFGRVKFQKLVYMCELQAKMKLQKRYSKQAAGPFDSKFMHSINKEFEKQKWFRIEQIKSGGFVKPVYTPLKNCGKYKSYYEKYFSEFDDAIQSIIKLFRKMDTAFTEIAATLIACNMEIIEEKQIVDDEELLARFYAWSPQKSQYKESKVTDALRWVKDRGLI